MSQLKKLAGETVWYGLSSIIGRVISYLLTPLYTTVFLPGEYGVVTELYGYAAFLNIVYIYGLETAYFRFATKDMKNAQGFFNITVSSIFMTSIVLSAILILFSSQIVETLGYPGQEQVVYWLSAILAVDALVAIPFARLRLERKARRFATAKLINITLTIALNLFFLVVCDKIYEGVYLEHLRSSITAIYNPNFQVKYVFLSNLIANGLYIILLADLFIGFRLTVNWSKLKPLITYGLPLLFMGLAVVTNEMLSRVLLKYWLPEGFYPSKSSLDALGIFGACYKLSVFMTLGIQAFRYAAEPFFFSNASDKNSPELFSKVMHGFLIFNAVVFLAISVNLEFLGFVFLRMEAYREGLYIVPFLLLGGLLLGVYYNLSLWFKLTDKTIYGAYITGLGALVTIILNLLLIPVLGYFGSALTTMITYLIMVITSYSLGRKHYPIPYKVTGGLLYIVSSAGLAFLFYNVDTENFASNLLVRNLGVVVFLVMVYLIERKHIKGKAIWGIRIP